jgi:hypothetical protein
MCNSFFPPRQTWIPAFLAAIVAIVSHPAAAQPSADDSPVTYEVQINGEGFQVEGGQRPIKVESKLKPGTVYTLAVRVSMTQVLRLNSVQLEYGMWAKVVDDKRKGWRTAQIIHDLAFSLEINDLGRFLDDKGQAELLKTVADELEKRFTDHKATDLKRTELNDIKIGSSAAKRLRFNFKDSKGVAGTCMIFVLSGEKYTVYAVAQFRDQDQSDAGPWVSSALKSIRPLEQ